MILISFIYRSKNSGFSIETIFFNLSEELLKQFNCLTRACFAPHRTLSLKNIIENLRFAYRQRTQTGIYHITGETHYLSLMLPPTRTVITIHDCVSLDRQQQAGNRIQYWLLWLLYYYLPMRRATYLTTVSEKSRQELIRHMGKPLVDKVQVIPNFYNPVYTCCPKPFDAEMPTLLHVGTTPHKNLSRLIEAVEGLHCRLIIVGTLSAQEQAALINRQIVYEQYDQVNQKQLIALYIQCDIVAFVSLYEGFGLPVLEAQAVGRPVLTSAISPMTDVGGAGACYVNPTDSKAIRAGVLRIWHDETYRTGLIDAGLLNAQQYTISAVAPQYMALYSSISTTINPHKA
jgi:glycosyltransferase involved in cell wall biosynthesis